MLRNEIEQDALFVDLKDIVENLGMILCDVKKTMNGSTVQISVAIMKGEGETGIDECAKVHNTILPRLQMRYGRDDLYVEVSTPGIQRIFRDVYEFRIFKGKRVRVYDLGLSSWVTGICGGTENSEVILSDYEVEDSAQKGELLRIGYDKIQKARLEYKWEDVKNVRVK